MIATHDREQTSRLWELPLLNVLYPCSVDADGDLMLTFASDRTRVATDTAAVVYNEPKICHNEDPRKWLWQFVEQTQSTRITYLLYRGTVNARNVGLRPLKIVLAWFGLAFSFLTWTIERPKEHFFNTKHRNNIIKEIGCEAFSTFYSWIGVCWIFDFGLRGPQKGCENTRRW